MIKLTEQSDSGLPIIKKCIGSGALQRAQSTNPAAIMGSAIHKHHEQRAHLGVQMAIAMLDETIDEFELSEVHASIARARCRNSTFEPPRGSGAEIALAWRIDGEQAEVVKVRGGQGSYHVPTGVGAPGTIDLIYAEPEPLLWSHGQATCPRGSTLHVLDYKTGEDAWVDPIDHNAQLASAAAKAAYWTGATRVIPEILFLENRDHWWDRVEKPWDEDRIDKAMWDTFELHTRVQEARQKPMVASELVEGYYCRFCPSLAYCPLQGDRIRNLMSLKIDRVEGPLDPKEISRVAAMLPVLNELAAWCDHVVKAYANEHGPIDVGAGRLYGRRTRMVDALDARKMWPILVEVLEDTDAPYEAVKMKKTYVDNAIRLAHSRKGVRRQKAAAMRRILAMGHASGAIEKEEQDRWGIYIPGTDTDQE